MPEPTAPVKTTLAVLLRDSVPEFAPAAAVAETPSATVVAFPARQARKI